MIAPLPSRTPLRRLAAPLVAVALLAGILPAGRAYAAAVVRDSTQHRLLPAWTRLTLAGGLGGMTAPAAPRRQYQPGVSVALQLRAMAKPGLRALASLAYQDLPPQNDLQQRGDFDSSGVIARGFGGGTQFAFLAGVEARAFGPVFVRLEGGTSYHRAGAVYDLVIPGPGGTLPEAFPEVPDRTGWGATWAFGASYEFQPTPRDHYVIESTITTARSGAGDLLRFVGFRFGYRLY